MNGELRRRGDSIVAPRRPLAADDPEVEIHSSSISRRIARMARRLLSVLFFVSVNCFGVGLSVSAAEEISIKPAANVDERLFLTYVVHGLYDSFPTELSDPTTVQRALSDIRRRATRFHQYSINRNLGSELTSLFADCLAAVDAYTALLEQLGRIERGAVVQRDADAFDTGTVAGANGSNAALDSYQNGASGTESILTGLAIGAIDAFINDYQKGQVRDEQRLAAVRAAGADLEKKLVPIVARLENLEDELSGKYGWGAHETRSTDTEAETQLLAELVGAGNLTEIRRLLDRRAERRSRDAFLLLGKEYLVVHDSSATPQSLLAAAKRCVQHSALIPADRIYDDYRTEALSLAAILSTGSWERELQGASWAAANSSSAKYALSLWDVLLKHAPADETGEWREQRAWSLMASGRPGDALQQANEIYSLRKNDGSFAFNYARLLSYSNQPQAALASLQTAVRQLGYDAIAAAKTDPDFAVLREAGAKEFRALAAVKATWNIQFGILNDDIVLTNYSTFPLTNVRFACRIVSNSRPWTPTLMCEHIKPGETYKWVNAVSIPGGKVDQKTATLSCDQSEIPITFASAPSVVKAPTPVGAAPQPKAVSPSPSPSGHRGSAPLLSKNDEKHVIDFKKDEPFFADLALPVLFGVATCLGVLLLYKAGNTGSASSGITGVLSLCLGLCGVWFFVVQYNPSYIAITCTILGFVGLLAWQLFGKVGERPLDVFSSSTNLRAGPDKRIIACGKCGQKLRVPAVASGLVITCGRCRNRFELPS